MIYSCTLYNGEKNLLKIKCEELKPLNVIHVVVESIYTFSGKPKVAYFHKHKDEFKDYPIIHIIKIDPPDPDPWRNEQLQRDACMGALQGCNDDDIIIIADCDEIPKAHAIVQYNPEHGPMALVMDLYYYYLNVLSGRNQWTIGRILPWSYLKNTTPNAVRNAGMSMGLMDAGWHYTYMGGVDTMLKKFASFSHQEEAVQKLASEELLRGKLDRLESLTGTERYSVVGVDNLPRCVQENVEELFDLLYIV